MSFGRVNDDNAAKRPTLLYTDLIKSRRSTCASLSQTSRSVLRDAVFQLVTFHQNTDSLMSEVLKLNTNASIETEMEVSGSTQNVVPLLPTVSQCLYHDATVQGQSSNIAAAEICAGKIVEIINYNHGDVHREELLTSAKRDELKMCLLLIQKFIQEQQFHRPHFITVLSKQISLPLEVIWHLHASEVIPLESFISSKIGEASFTQDFACQLFRLCCDPGESEPIKHEVLKGFISFLINHGFPEKRKTEEISGSLKKVCISVLDGLTKSLLDDPQERSMLNYVCVTACTEILPVSLRKFCTHTLSLTMSYKPCLKVSEALKQQRNWKSAKVETGISYFYRQMFVPFEASEILEILQRILDRQEVNWETILSFLATYLVCFPEAPELINGHISKVLKEGLNNSEMENTIIAFLLARQCCLEGLHVFPTYQDWFQKTFGDVSRSPASNRKSFTFLMKFLTDIVPYEFGKHLKVHILRPPYVPPKCRDLLSDYVALAKTRLADLKETLESGGIYDDGLGESSTKQTVQRCEQDVLTALTAFESTGKVPSTVMEASIFRKPYFIGKFLPALLKPRPLPDKHDSRMQMIEALRKADKILPSLYKKYEEACKNEAQQLLDGVFEGQHDEMEDLMMAPLEQLQFRLDQLVDVVVKTETSKSDPHLQKVSEVISIVSEKLELVVDGSSSDQSGVDCPLTEINLSSPDLTDIHIQIVDSLLNFICKCLTRDLQNSTPQISWLLKFTKMLSEHNIIHRALFTRFYYLIRHSSELKEHHITGLSALAACIAVLQPAFGFITVHVCSICRSHSTTGSFLDVLLAIFPCKTACSMDFSLRFWSEYLKFIFLQFELTSASHVDDQHGIVPADLVRKFVFLCWRFLPELRKDNFDVISPDDKSLPRTIFLSDKFQQCLKEAKITSTSWIDFEMAISAEDDHLSYFERQAFHEWAIYHHFVQASDDEGFNFNFSRLSSALFQAVLKSHMRSSSCGGYPACGNCKKKGDHSCRTNSLEFLSFLQTSIHHLSSQEDNSGVPWLLRQLDEFMSSDAPGDRSDCWMEQARIGVFFRVISLLPPHLFLSDQPCVLPDKQMVQEIISRIERYVVHLVEGCALPISVTSYLLQSIVIVKRSASQVDTLQCLTTHRLISISCLVHWDTINSLLSSWNEDKDELFSHLYSVKHWFRRCVEVKRLESVPPHLPSWLCAAQLFAAAVAWKSVHDVECLVDVVENHHFEILASFCDILLCYICGLVASNKNGSELVSLRRVFLKVLSHHPDIFPFILNEEKRTDLMNRLMSTDVCRGHTLLSLLPHLDAQRQISVFQHKSNVHSVLQLFQQLCTQFEDCASHVTQSISLTAVTSHAQFIKSILLNVPLSCVRGLDESTLVSCGYDIKRTVAARLTSGH